MGTWVLKGSDVIISACVKCLFVFIKAMKCHFLEKDSRLLSLDTLGRQLDDHGRDSFSRKLLIIITFFLIKTHVHKPVFCIIFWDGWQASNCGHFKGLTATRRPRRRRKKPRSNTLFQCLDAYFFIFRHKIYFPYRHMTKHLRMNTKM